MVTPASSSKMEIVSWYGHEKGKTMENEKVKLIRTISGEYLLGLSSQASSIDGKIKLKSVRKLSMAMTISGEASVALVPLCPFSIKKQDDLEIKDDFVLFQLNEDELQKELVTSYRSEISGISLVSSGPTNLIV